MLDHKMPSTITKDFFSVVSQTLDMDYSYSQ